MSHINDETKPNSNRELLCINPDISFHCLLSPFVPQEEEKAKLQK